jgi:type VI protein secretion system component VasF
MLNNPYMAADVDADTTPRRLGRRKTWLTVAVGAVSLATLVYLLVFYSVVISLQSRGLTNQMDVIMCKPPVAAAHVAVCAGGGATALWMTVHALRNRQLRLWRRVAWAVALAVGFGMIFYWYFHLQSAAPRGQ